MNQVNNFDLLVIGGGASGMMSALVAAQSGARVALIEKNARLGEKLRISGGGRCNILNAEEDTRALLKHYGKAEQFLYSAFSTFGMQQTYDFFEELGLPLTVEANKRTFPASQKAEDVVESLHRAMQQANVALFLNTTVTNIQSKKGRIQSVQCGDQIFSAKQYILSTGGLSRPETGSTGDGFAWLEKLGHSIDEPSPNITPLALNEPWLDKVAGKTIEIAAITFYADEVKKFKVNGRLLFTHFGISGPLILNNAYRVAELLEAGSDVHAYIDSLPTMTLEQLDAKIIKLIEQNPRKQFKNILKEIVPNGLSVLVYELLSDDIDFDKKTSEFSRANRQHLAQTLKAIPITVEKLMGFDKAVVADGGIPLTEVDMRTFRSHKCDNLYILGDLLNINRPSGGYSLQLCWTSGYIAGNVATA